MPSDPAVQAHDVLVKKITAVPPNRIVGGYADEADLETRASHLLNIARIVDAYILALGRDVKENIAHAIDLEDFTDQVIGAVEGNATYQLSRMAQRMREARYARPRAGTAS
jgi:hypothetical protein